MTSMDINDILKRLPHRYPFLLVDRVISCEPGKSAVALKNVTMNEPFFTGHFPNYPVMPGVLIIEALAQAAALLAYETVGGSVDPDTIMFFAGIDNARFKRPVVPGDTLMLHVTLLRHKSTVWKFSAQARVGDELAAEAELMCAAKSVAGPDA